MSTFVVGSSGGARTIQSGSAPTPKKFKSDSAIRNDPFGRALSLYQLPPIGEISPDEFETLAVDRLRCTWIEILGASIPIYRSAQCYLSLYLLLSDSYLFLTCSFEKFGTSYD